MTHIAAKITAATVVRWSTGMLSASGWAGYEHSILQALRCRRSACAVFRSRNTNFLEIALANLHYFVGPTDPGFQGMSIADPKIDKVFTSRFGADRIPRGPRMPTRKVFP
jgi:hypothetical protein